MNQTSGDNSSTRGNSARAAAYLRRVTTLARQGNYDEAIQAMEKAIALAPDKPGHCVRLAGLYRAQRKMDKAIQAIERAIELDPYNPSPQEALLQIYVEAGKYDEAISGSKGLLKRYPRNTFALDVLGLSYLQKGMLDEALQVTSRLVRLAPLDSANHYKKAVLFQQKGDCARAIEEFSRVIEMDPDGDLSTDAREAIASLDEYQLRQIATLATEDRLFMMKLLRNPDGAARERGFVLSVAGIMALKQMDFTSLSSHGSEQQKYYH
ncbi:MAG: tetratricopeptide repeat protein [Armatimonadota bacterium]